MIVADWSSFFLHLPIGIIAALLLLSHKNGWALTLCLIISFLVYEVTQNDRSWLDIQGTIVGIPIGGLLIWLLMKLRSS